MLKSKAAGGSRVVLLLTVCLAAGLLALFKGVNRKPLAHTETPTGQTNSGNARAGLIVFCAAGLKQPIERIATAYQSELKTEVALQYGGTATLLAQLRITGAGDVFVAADAGSLEDARKTGAIQEVIPLVRQRPVLAVRAGNPLGLKTLDDLFRPEVKIAIANPEAASVGKATRKALGKDWERFAKHVTVTKPTVTEIAADLSIGAVDAAILWNSTVPQFKNIEAVELPVFSAYEDVVSAAVLSGSKNPTSALAFARYLAAPEKGGPVFQQNGFDYISGDPWALEPEMTIYSGGLNRLSIESLLNRFAQREGVKLTTVYNGCGVLCATMKSMEKGGTALPDVYYACDITFVPPVAAHFPKLEVLTATRLGILVQKGNPHGIKTVADLSKAGLRVGLCNVRQSTLGYLTEGVLRSSGASEAVRKNVVAEVPTADFLVNQLRTGGLDACIVYEANAVHQAGHLEFIVIEQAGVVAKQPFGIGAQSHRQQLAGRLLSFFKANRAEFEKAGFEWMNDGHSLNSAEIITPDWLNVNP